MVSTSVEKIVEVDSHIGCAVSGLVADSRTMIDKARVEAQNYWFTYNEQMSVESVCQAVANLAIQFGEEDPDPGAMSRPFGVALLVAGIDEKGPQLFHMDPSDTLFHLQCLFVIADGLSAITKLLQWLEAQLSEEEPHSVIKDNINCLKRDHVLQQIRSLVQDNPEVAMDSIVHMTQHMSPSQRNEVARILATMDTSS
ncbi:proteasome subunit alpha type-5-like [Branchiostoma floridae]|uniref:Proteasome subunit alpha type-5-like n=1 Tax=Branchiostoma floridae TaxID=7739 RepID=A0A9J7KHS5_BRAFL|nr:proteasome subunit alpha type-5-like [Branchiostoma floridae]